MNVTEDKPTFLCSAKNNIEVDVIESLLKSEQIPVLKKWRSGADVTMLYMAVSTAGADLYVPSPLWERAKLLLSAETEITETDTNNMDKNFFENKRRTRAKWILLFILALLTFPFVINVFFVFFMQR